MLSGYVSTLLSLSLLNCLLALGLGVVTSYAGQFSLGHAAFMAVGAYVSAGLTTVAAPSGAWIAGTAGVALAIALATLAAAAVGWLVGLPSLRLKGDYLAVVTLGTAEIVRIGLLNIDPLGGPRGLPGIPATVGVGTLVVCVVVVWAALRLWLAGPAGDALAAVRGDELAAESVGISSTRVKVQAFAVGAAIAGLAGGLGAHFFQYISPASFDLTRSFEIVVMVVLGGLAPVRYRLEGLCAAATGLTLLKEALRPLVQWTHWDLRMLLIAVTLIAIMRLAHTRTQGVAR